MLRGNQLRVIWRKHLCWTIHVDPKGQVEMLQWFRSSGRANTEKTQNKKVRVRLAPEVYTNPLFLASSAD